MDVSGVCYYDKTEADLKYAEYDGSQWQLTTVDSNGNTSLYTSLYFPSSSRPAITYYDETERMLKIAEYAPIVCIIEETALFYSNLCPKSCDV